MLNESLSLLSLFELKDILFYKLTILHVAYVYILMYVVYKAIGRYLYFKPQEHASKINRTFLTLSLLIVAVHTFRGIANYFPILPEYHWLYLAFVLILITAVLSILTYRMIWKYDGHGSKSRRNWHYNYLPISKDYYKTNVSKNRSEGNTTHYWEEEGVESTSQNIHSDALLNVLALITFIVTITQWTYQSMHSYGWYSLVFSLIISLPITGVFFNEVIFSWISHIQKRN